MFTKKLMNCYAYIIQSNSTFTGTIIIYHVEYSIHIILISDGLHLHVAAPQQSMCILCILPVFNEDIVEQFYSLFYESVRTIVDCAMRRRSGQKGDETAKPVEFCENRRVMQEPSSYARTVEFCKNRRIPRDRFCDIGRVLRDRSNLVTTENSVVGFAEK